MPHSTVLSSGMYLSGCKALMTAECTIDIHPDKAQYQVQSFIIATQSWSLCHSRTTFCLCTLNCANGYLLLVQQRSVIKARTIVITDTRSNSSKLFQVRRTILYRTFYLKSMPEAQLYCPVSVACRLVLSGLLVTLLAAYVTYSNQI